jgi:hypothetical protein
MGGQVECRRVRVRVSIGRGGQVGCVEGSATSIHVLATEKTFLGLGLVMTIHASLARFMVASPPKSDVSLRLKRCGWGSVSRLMTFSDQIYDRDSALEAVANGDITEDELGGGPSEDL